MNRLRSFLVALAMAGLMFLPRLAFAARGGASGVITPSANGTVLKTQSGLVLSLTYTADSTNGEIAIYNWNATTPPASSLVWEGRVATANNSYNHTFQTPLICTEGIVVQVGNGQAFLEVE